MKTLALTFTKLHFHFRQVQRSGDIAIYERHKDGIAPHFEVIRIRQNPQWTAFGRVFEPAESYPLNEEWGTNGFTCLDLENAKTRKPELPHWPMMPRTPQKLPTSPNRRNATPFDSQRVGQPFRYPDTFSK